MKPADKFTFPVVAKYTMGITVMITGTPAHRIRKYEEAGICKPIRSASQQRLFTDGDIQLIRQISALEDSGVNLAGIKIIHVAYKGEAPALTDIMGGHLPMMFSNMSACLPHVKAGKIRGLAVSSMERVAAAPEIPTVAESGVPGFEAETWFGLLAPAATPPEIIRRLNADVLKALTKPDVKEKLASLGLTITGSTPEKFSAYIKSEYSKWAKVIKDAGIKME